MEELLSLIKAIADLPTMALWVLAGYLVYRLAILGSAYATIRFTATKIHDAYIARQNNKVKEAEINAKAQYEKNIVLYKWRDGLEPISEEVKNSIITSLNKLKVHGASYNTSYVHQAFATELDQVINEYITKLPKNASKI